MLRTPEEPRAHSHQTPKAIKKPSRFRPRCCWVPSLALPRLSSSILLLDWGSAAGSWMQGLEVWRRQVQRWTTKSALFLSFLPSWSVKRSPLDELSGSSPPQYYNLLPDSSRAAVAHWPGSWNHRSKTFLRKVCRQLIIMMEGALSCFGIEICPSLTLSSSSAGHEEARRAPRARGAPECEGQMRCLIRAASLSLSLSRSLFQTTSNLSCRSHARIPSRPKVKR